MNFQLNSVEADEGLKKGEEFSITVVQCHCPQEELFVVSRQQLLQSCFTKKSLPSSPKVVRQPETRDACLHQDRACRRR